MPRASAAAAAQTAQRILDSATELFATRGFGEVSLDDVAREARVTRGAVYHHYRNKAGLFGAVAAALQSDVARAVVAAAQDAGTQPSEQLRAGSHAFLDAITDGSAVRILLIDAPAVIGWQEWRRLDAANSATHLREALRDVGVAEDLLDASTAQLSGAMNEAALWTAQHTDTDLAREQSHLALDRLLAAYLP
ncbi:TetR family transcriptional regulator [Gordonia sp. 852002-50816_SCH5313054-c]|uniref:TetR/AcrR family transcriptional regulator n=1 Tax=unclassified Gordonia (in: high G+C Gram-positive bacteria) TaxID=2657482 RepID=UPI0007EBAE5D|nr:MULTISPECIES: TetR/AcrR family transcriptional regulator [unclassified Gordonia (in: high G+C Gram-positive bacteria)]OBC07873.1 TetR family transcriptional regulator [Gordonia sp. 852002-50816_SCH5313054-a]OBC15656.1 TetR family transcriptional regulator [Gordonia sp. 852002-50816_SCH5313054-c]